MGHKSLYKITVTNFLVRQKSLKKGHKSTLISNNFCTDNKLGMLPLSHRWLFLGILLECGNSTTDTVELNEKQLRDLLESSKSVESALDALQSLQLLSFTKTEFLINRIEKNRIEKNRNIIMAEPENQVQEFEPQKPNLALVTTPVGVAPTINQKQTFSVQTPEELSQALDNRIKTNLLELYPDEKFIRDEFTKMINWLIPRPRKNLKTRRGWAQFVCTWLDGSWPKFQKNLSSAPNAQTVDDLMKRMGWA